ncbi:hypothetical protein U1Q18_036449 [Sarracenia purpurea var. burkii]
MLRGSLVGISGEEDVLSPRAIMRVGLVEGSVLWKLSLYFTALILFGRDSRLIEILVPSSCKGLLAFVEASV